MRNSPAQRNVFRALLVFHFIGLALTIGMRFASLVIDHIAEAGSLRTLAFARDLTGVLARSLALPGFLLIVGTGIAMALLRYGSRQPIWVWMKIGVTAAALAIATPVVAPALAAARMWAQWSAEHGQLAPQFLQSASRANVFGAIVFSLFLSNIVIAVWKPFASNKAKISKSRDASASKVIQPPVLHRPRSGGH